MIAAWLLKNWRLLAYAAAAAAALWMLALVGHWRKDSTERLPAAEAALELETSCGPGSACAARAARLQAEADAKSREVVDEYERQLADLRSRPVPAVPVRLCRPANRGPVRDGAATPATGPGSGSDVPLEAGRDIAVELYRLADDADAEALKLKALWQWNEALSAD